MENFEKQYKERKAKAEERASALARILIENGREDELFRAAEDVKFREQLYHCTESRKGSLHAYQLGSSIQPNYRR